MGWVSIFAPMYYIVYGFLWLLSLLPIRVLYFFSDAIYGLVFYILKYRRDVVLSNIKLAFPEKTDKERMRIAKDFYHNLIDTFIETIKLITASQKFLDKRFKGNWELINSLKEDGRPIQLHIGHNFNWEWGNAVAAPRISLPWLGVYMPISNKIFDRLFIHLRSRTGTKLLRATHMAEDFLPYRNTRYVLGLAVDQSPGNPSNAWWVNFFNHPTPFVKGPAKAAILNDTIVIFAFIYKPRRGYYEVVFSIGTTTPKNETEISLTLSFVHYLEEVIRKYPSMWLWSHRRWKHSWKEEYGEVL
jgi:KDO2-lipid IV(A) lauroyltransferase